MTRSTILKFGLFGGLILALFVAIQMPLVINGTINFSSSEIIGYSSMILSFLMVFLGIRSYREQAGGSITFGKAFQVGILITLVICAAYVVTWEIYYYGFNPDFGEKYTSLMVEKMRTEGASDAAIAAERARMAPLWELYKNPLVNIGMTFLEVFPVGLIITLVSAGILRRRDSARGALASA